jgi:hypothetical protein
MAGLTTTGFCGPVPMTIVCLGNPLLKYDVEYVDKNDAPRNYSVALAKTYKMYYAKATFVGANVFNCDISYVKIYVPLGVKYKVNKSTGWTFSAKTRILKIWNNFGAMVTLTAVI